MLLAVVKFLEIDVTAPTQDDEAVERARSAGYLDGHSDGYNQGYSEGLSESRELS